MKKVVCHISKCLDAKPSAAVAALTLHTEGIQDGEKENTDPELRSLSKGWFPRAQILAFFLYTETH